MGLSELTCSEENLFFQNVTAGKQQTSVLKKWLEMQTRSEEKDAAANAPIKIMGRKWLEKDWPVISRIHSVSCRAELA
jgi:hypothetical protein